MVVNSNNKCNDKCNVMITMFHYLYMCIDACNVMIFLSPIMIIDVLYPHFGVKARHMSVGKKEKNGK